MTKITWLIEWIESSTSQINGRNKYVLAVGWRCTGANESYNATIYGTCEFLQTEINENFTNYSDLTQDQILIWCWNNGADKANTEEKINEQIQNQINPPVVQLPLPWQS